MDAQQQLFGLMAVAEEQQKAVHAAIDALKHERKAFERTTQNITEQIASDVREASAKAQQHSHEAAALLRGEIKSILWRIAAAILVTVTVVSWLLVWYQRHEIESMSERRQALKDELATMERSVAMVAKKGGRIVFNTCGDDARLCIAIAKNQGFNTHAVGSYESNDKQRAFVIPEGY